MMIEITKKHLEIRPVPYGKFASNILWNQSSILPNIQRRLRSYLKPTYSKTKQIKRLYAQKPYYHHNGLYKQRKK